MSVFVVDDHKSSADTLAALLKSEGYDVQSFYSPFAAVEAAAIALPDILITDFSMPGMDGMMLASYIRERNPDCKIVVISADVSAFRNHPAFHVFPVLEKPVEVATLLSVIHSVGNRESVSHPGCSPFSVAEGLRNLWLPR